VAGGPIITMDRRSSAVLTAVSAACTTPQCHSCVLSCGLASEARRSRLGPWMTAVKGRTTAPSLHPRLLAACAAGSMPSQAPHGRRQVSVVAYSREPKLRITAVAVPALGATPWRNCSRVAEAGDA
jgi:hypothetical protein